jgi:hypothetical protein
LQLRIQRDQKRDRARRLLRQAFDELRQQRPGRFGRKIGGEFALQFVGVGERELFGVGLDEEIERIDHRELGGEVDLDAEFLGLFGKNEPREPVAVRVLLPIDEMVGRRNLQRIARHPGAAVRRRAQPDDLGAERNRAIVEISRDVLQSDQNRQDVPSTNVCAGRAIPYGALDLWISPAGRRECQCVAAEANAIA